jgi:putative membrane protein
MRKRVAVWGCDCHDFHQGKDRELKPVKSEEWVGISSEIRPDLTNRGEFKSFLKTALAIQGSASPAVTKRVLSVTFFSLACSFLFHHYPQVSVPITPFEYSGAVLSLFLLLRINSGLDRWWEARKVWGSIVNQSRNLAIIGSKYSSASPEVLTQFLNWVATWPHVMRESLRNERDLFEVNELLGTEQADKIRESQHMPTYVGAKVAEIIAELRKNGLDDFAFQRAERERALLIDAIGACERIRNTPIPFSIAIIVRRFILLFLLLLPLGLVDRVVWLTPIVVALAAYPLFYLDELGAELQNPFSPRNLSHLPLKSICLTIQSNVKMLVDESQNKTN